MKPPHHVSVQQTLLFFIAEYRITATSELVDSIGLKLKSIKRLSSQPTLPGGFAHSKNDLPEFGAACLPNLTRVTAPFSALPQLIPNRPVKEVISLGTVREGDSVDISFFTLSNSPIQKLKIDYTYLYPKSGQYLSSIFSSLTTLEITANTHWFLATVRDPPFIIIIYL